MAPERQERPPYARVEHHEPLVPLVQLQPPRAHAQRDLIPPEHLAVCAQVVARIGPVDGADVGRALRDLQLLGCLVVHAVEDEDEVGCGVQAVVEEEAQVVARYGRVGEGVEDQGPPWVVGGRGQWSLGLAAGGVELPFGDVGVDGLDWLGRHRELGLSIRTGPIKLERPIRL